MRSRMARVLIADGDRATRETVATALRGAGWEVAAVDNGEDALRECAIRDPDVVLVDLLLPGMSAPAFVRACRRLPGSCARLVAVSALPRARELAKHLGCDVALRKPFDLRQLLATVERVAKGRVLRRGATRDRAI